MDQPPIETDIIDLTFAMEANSSLWNIIFEGFDQEVVLVSKFTSKEPKAINTLYRFGFLICERYKDCKVEPKNSGIEIRKSLPENDFDLVGEWTALMESVCEEMKKCVNSEEP
ncbi:MAG: hypothetical protein AAF462_01685 [Thermodesulfobacteriota bacterium]